jgi:hypothetical protein
MKHGELGMVKYNLGVVYYPLGYSIMGDRRRDESHVAFWRYDPVCIKW